MNKEKYKELSVKLSENYNIANIMNIITKINDKFSDKDIFLEITEDSVVIYLYQLDVDAFSKYINSIDNDETEFIVKLIECITSIKSYGIKGKKRVFVDYNKERKVANRKSKENDRNQNFYADSHVFAKENNSVPPEYLNKIICDKSENFLKKLPDNCIDLVITSPPYNFGLAYENHYDANLWDTYFEKLFEIFDECIRVLKYGGRIIVNVQPLFSDYIPTHHIISNHFLQRKMIWKGEIIWEKNNYNCKYTAWGSWKSPSSPYLKYTWEFIEIFCKGDLKKPGNSNNIDISAEEFKQWVVAKWSIAPERKMKEYGHPAMFPEQLVERALKLFSYKNDVILDPFNGAGTSTLVAHKNDRNYIGIDISEEYCKTAEERILKSRNQMSIL
ncbi:MAG: site-specific DNA-methyltransferase [Tissierellia bacterium]|nr:site-specific DNA-methyltransferase [Tissierellia bacterium]